MPVHCYAAPESRAPLTPYSYEPLPLGPFDVEIAITHCGICRSDIHLIDNESLGPLAVEVARRSGWTAQTSGATPNSDYFPLLRIGVPAVFLVPVPAAYEGLTLDSSNALRSRWDHYHQAADEWDPQFPFSGLVRYADYALRIGRMLASGARPTMNPGR